MAVGSSDVIESISMLFFIGVIDTGIVHTIDGTPPVTGRPERWYWVDQFGFIDPCRFLIVFAIVVEQIGGSGSVSGCWGRVVARVGQGMGGYRRCSGGRSSSGYVSVIRCLTGQFLRYRFPSK